MIRKADLQKEINELKFDIKSLNDFMHKSFQNEVWLNNKISELETANRILQHQISIKPLYEVGSKYGDYLITGRNCEAWNSGNTVLYIYEVFDTKNNKKYSREQEHNLTTMINFKRK